ncbi:MAG: DUF433 domain-containing protein [Bacteroidetes bacterium]|jgi:uncharacterized protein (DUF433 family)|nr:MAG: DUF433 domain-containing protein [Bacteroidota bacterium]
MGYKNYLEAKADVMLGKPVIKGTRITVELVLKKMSEGASVHDIKEMYPELTSQQINACIEYAYDVVANEAFLNDVA